jgi:hypothetical protein
VWKVIPVPFPKNAVDRRWNFTESPQLTTASANNVRCTESIAGRERGGSRPGFSRVFGTPLSVAGGLGVNLMAVVRYVEDNHVKSHLVTAAGGAVKTEDGRGNLESITSTAISRWNDVQAADFQNKLYIANTGRSVQGDWITKQTVPIVLPPGRTHYEDFGGTFNGGIDYRANSIVGNSEATARIALDGPPLVFDPVAKTITALTVENYTIAEDPGEGPKGSVPTGCQIICVYSGSIFLAGDPASPGQWYKCRSLNPRDWDYSKDDATAAVSGTTARAGQISAPITAMAPHTDMCLIFACRTSLSILRGDPITGDMDSLSHEIGIIDKNAWCHTADGTMVFLSHDGVYALPGGCGTTQPTSLSREKIPEGLRGVDPNIFVVNLVYDVRARGVFICCAARDPAVTSQYWFLDWETKGFWPFTLPTNCDIFDCVYRRDIATDRSTVWFGCRDGYIRYFNEEASVDDESTQIDSYVLLGPFKAGDAVHAGIMMSLRAKLASSSAAVTWEVLAGNSAEEALAAAASYSGTWSLANMQYKQYPRVRGNELYVKVSGTSRWALDEIVAEMKPAGETRR